MTSNLERYKRDLDRLIEDGNQLLNAMHYKCFPEAYEKALKRILTDKAKREEAMKKLPDFARNYQTWYSQSLAVVKFLLPDRSADFAKLYEKPKGRKQIDYGNYVIEDYLQGLTVTRTFQDKPVVSPKAAIPQFTQQLNILNSARARFESSLFDMKQLLQADLFDSELEAARELNKKGFARGAGAMAGVVLEFHLAQVCENHKIKVSKKDPTINDLNELLKSDNVIEISTWRFIQHLADLRNKCDHKKSADPTPEEIDELIDGVGKTTKTLF